MAWISVVRTDALSPPPPPRVLDSLTSRDGVCVAVVDANALITSSSKLLGLADRFVTVAEVLEEVRDPGSRLQLAALPFTVDCMEPSEEALSRVVQFARETGDLHSLSDVDLKLIALSFTLEEQAHGSAHLRSRPPPLYVSQVRGIRDQQLPGWGSNVPNLEEWEEISQEADDAPESESHILGLKSLNLGTSELDGQRLVNPKVDDIIVGEGGNNDTISEGGNNVVGRHLGHVEECSENLSDSKMVEDEHRFIQNEAERVVCNEEAVTVAGIHSGHVEKHSRSKQAETPLGGKLMVSVGLDASKGEEENFEGDWQRAVSRSTRRKYVKRAARAVITDHLVSEPQVCTSYNTAVESIEGDDQLGHFEENDVSQGNECGHTERDSVCFNGDNVDSTDVQSGELMQDGDESNERCLMIAQDNTREEGPPSTYGADSEDSWMLRPLSKSNVACITADFAMQNVLLQIGLRVVSPNGLQVRQLHRWVLKCEACRNITSEAGHIFCPKCGNGGTLYKVSVTTGPNGVVHTGTRKRSNIRGTKYSLPMPKGGRKGAIENPVLREDQLPHKLLHPKKKKVSLSSQDVFVGSESFTKKSGNKGHMGPPIREALAIFSGKRNPNDRRFK